MDTHTEIAFKEQYKFKTFGSRLSLIMTMRDISNQELASEMVVSVSTISGYRTGRRSPKVDDLAKIALFLDVSVDFLIGLSDNPSRLSCKIEQSGQAHINSPSPQF